MALYQHSTSVEVEKTSRICAYCQRRASLTVRENCANVVFVDLCCECYWGELSPGHDQMAAYVPPASHLPGRKPLLEGEFEDRFRIIETKRGFDRSQLANAIVGW